MANLVTRKTSQYWYAQFTNEQGKRTTKATGILITPAKKKDGYTQAAAKAKALLIAEEFEATARRNRNAKHAANRVFEIAGYDHPEEQAAPNISEYIETYEKRRQEQKTKESTLQSDNRAFHVFMQWLDIHIKERGGKKCHMDIFTKGDASDFILAQSKRVSYGTVKRYFSSLRALFNDAIDRDLISKNPFKKLESMRGIRSESSSKQSFTVHEVTLLLEKTPDWVSRLIRCSLYLNGLRLGDAATLQWKQFDFDRGIFMARQQKTNGIVMFPIREELAAYLQSIRRHETGTYVNPQAVKLLQSFNTGILSQEVNSHIKGILGLTDSPMQNLSGDRRRVSPKTFHSLRKTAATLMVTSGVPAEVARHLTGHRSNAMLGRYVVPEADTLDEAQHKIPWIA